jgi:hypothetical protein
VEIIKVGKSIRRLTGDIKRRYGRLPEICGGPSATP